MNREKLKTINKKNKATKSLAIINSELNVCWNNTHEEKGEEGFQHIFIHILIYWIWYILIFSSELKLIFILKKKNKIWKKFYKKKNLFL